ncbi:hypothetical protein AB0C29_23900 [Actinoplanes sp. NPDC048791]|uniref:hypothetical protein n=1 Tax=Actinoplanes sp. NPDC048791 TaxID=3154623 RepID=UPI0033F1C352
MPVQVHCRLTVTIEDAGAVAALAVQRLGEAAIDWAEEEDDLATASGQLGDDLLACVASLADPARMFDGIPGVSVEGGHIWAERAR